MFSTNVMHHSTIIPSNLLDSSTVNPMSTTKADEWDYSKRSLTTAKIIFICAFGKFHIVISCVIKENKYITPNSSNLSNYPCSYVNHNCCLELEKQEIKTANNSDTSRRC